MITLLAKLPPAKHMSLVVLGKQLRCLSIATARLASSKKECGSFVFPPSPYAPKVEEVDKTGSTERWRNAFIAGLAAVGLLHLVVYSTTKHPERPEFIAYPHLRLRNRPFPWGDGNHTLFHNCEMNALPDGYEDCECDSK